MLSLSVGESLAMKWFTPSKKKLILVSRESCECLVRWMRVNAIVDSDVNIDVTNFKVKEASKVTPACQNTKNFRGRY